MTLRPITNRAASGQRFELPADRWIPLVENGETPVRLESGETVVQVVDAAALAALLNHFDPADKSARIDFDHFSYDPEKSSEAAGWNAELAIRHGALMALPRWSDTGEAALVNGRFRFISPAFDPARIEELGRDAQGRRRIRPLRLDSAGLTNNPNMRGLAPLANREPLSPEEPAAPASVTASWIWLRHWLSLTSVGAPPPPCRERKRLRPPAGAAALSPNGTISNFSSCSPMRMAFAASSAARVVRRKAA